MAGAGYEVFTVFEPDPAESDALSQIGERTNSVGVVRFVKTDDTLAADVWVAGRARGTSPVRQTQAEPATPEAASTVAIHAVELLRASLLELSESETRPLPREGAPGQGDSSSAPSLNAETPSFAAWSARAGVGALATQGGLPLAWAPVLAVGYRPLPAWVCELAALGPATGSVENALGSAQFDAEMVVLRLTFRALSDRHLLVPEVVWGAGAFRLGASGNAEAPLVATSAHAWAALALLGAGLELRATRVFSAVLEGDAFVSTPETVLRFGGEPVSRTTRPGLLGTASIKVAW